MRTIGQCVKPALMVLTVGLAIAVQASAEEGPRYRADGPDAERYGRDDGYPMCTGLTYIDDWRCRVGAFSNFGKLFPSRVVRAPATASPLKRAATEPAIRYQLEGKTYTLDDYLNTRPITGLLVARDDTILIERYQYGRNDKHLMTSFSMAKSIIGLLVGLAIDRGAIKSIDDTAETYVPGLNGTEYGRTPIKALLQMASGVAFNENYADRSADIYTLARLTLEQDPAGTLEAVKRFNTRRYPPGEKFSYSSADSSVLGLVVAGATGRRIADLASEWLWQPLGAESDANWNVDATGQEITYAYYNAVLRDWARLGLMLANKGNWSGTSVVPESWLAVAATRQPNAPSPTYGYQFWISPVDPVRFSLRGLRGQWVVVDPRSRTVLVQTSLDTNEHADMQLAALWLGVLAEMR
jgi:CubicO group peptidase (beta-lactamase class C family)